MLTLSPDDMHPREVKPWLRSNWKSLVARPSLPAVMYEHNAGPSGTGMYLLWGADDSLLYVGLASDIAARLVSHTRAGRIPFTMVSHMLMPRIICTHVEAAHIDALRPPYNRKLELARWDGHLMMVLRIRRAWARALQRGGS